MKLLLFFFLLFLADPDPYLCRLLKLACAQEDSNETTTTETFDVCVSNCAWANTQVDVCSLGNATTTGGTDTNQIDTDELVCTEPESMIGICLGSTVLKDVSVGDVVEMQYSYFPTLWADIGDDGTLVVTPDMAGKTIEFTGFFWFTGIDWELTDDDCDIGDD